MRTLAGLTTLCFACSTSMILSACSASTVKAPADFNGPGADGAISDPSDTGSIGLNDDGGLTVSEDAIANADSPSNLTTDCSNDATQLIYIVSESYDLYSYAPATNTLTSIGNVNCPSSGSNTPFSMAVDRSATAWVVYDDGNLYKVNTTTAACTASGYKKGQGGVTTFGMAFVSNTSGGSDETLFVSPDSSDGSGADLFGGVGTINTSTLTYNFVGGGGGSSNVGAADLTGRGDALLFGFANGDSLGVPSAVIAIDKTSGNVTGQKALPTDFTVGQGWAFATWGGYFWLFSQNGADAFGDGNDSSDITKFDYSTGAATTAKSNIGFLVVGAGVSTCAPTVSGPS